MCILHHFFLSGERMPLQSYKIVRFSIHTQKVSPKKTTLFTLLWEVALNIFFPKFCISCRKIGSVLCEQCFEKIHFYTLPLPHSSETLFLDQLIAAGAYQPPLSTLITTFKYQSIRDIGTFLGRMLYHCIDLPDTDIITAVPIHPKRMKARGFNQAELIAQEIAELSDIPYEPLLIRIKHSKPQASLQQKSDRLTHLKNTFLVASSQEKKIKNSRILLIDDVTTTGTTLNSCAEVLKLAGAKEIIGLTVAHEG